MNDPDQRAAILCSHVAKNQMPICRAVRDEPVEPEDSGWQFLCGCASHESSDLAEVWSVSEVIEYEPSLEVHIELPPGTVLVRSNNVSEWQTSK